jgi:hypothetical protein
MQKHKEEHAERTGISSRDPTEFIVPMSSPDLDLGAWFGMWGIVGGLNHCGRFPAEEWEREKLGFGQGYIVGKAGSINGLGFVL